MSGVLPPEAADRRPPARRARPLRRVQGVQGRVPDRRRHGQAQVRGAGAAPQRARRAPALAALRQHPHAEPLRARRRPRWPTALSEIAPLRWLLQRFGGIHAVAAAARFAPQTFPPGSAAHTARRRPPRAPGGCPARRLASRPTTSRGRRARRRVLERAGYAVELVGRRLLRPSRSRRACLRCHGGWRAAIRDGPCPRRRRRADRGHEPSCLLTFGDETPTLLPATRTTVRRGTRPAGEGCCARRATRDGSAGRGLVLAGRQVLLHAHCHQKAGWAAATVGAAAPIPGIDVKVLDTGCCGMAGSFGFEEEHYDMSMAMGAAGSSPPWTRSRPRRSSPPAPPAATRFSTARAGLPGTRSELVAEAMTSASVRPEPTGSPRPPRRRVVRLARAVGRKGA